MLLSLQRETAIPPSGIVGVVIAVLVLAVGERLST